MEQLFINPGGELRERWKQAFPTARVASSTADIGAATSKARGVVWLDVAVTQPEDRIAEVKAAVAFGWPVVVMGDLNNMKKNKELWDKFWKERVEGR